MGCFSPDIPPVPGPTQEEQQLTALQLQEYKDAIAEDKAIRQAVEQVTGKPYSATMADLTKTSLDLNRAATDRYSKAMAGELDVDPTLTRSIGEQEQALRTQMQRQLGPGWESSTVGQQALAEFKKRSNELQYSARRGEITSAEQQGYAMNPVSWVPAALGNKTVNMTDLLSNLQRGRLNQYGMEVNAAQQEQNPLASILGIGAGSMMGGLGKSAAGGISGLMPKLGGVLGSL